MPLNIVDSTNNVENEAITQNGEKHKITFILFYAFGLLTNVPQHFFVTANSYWMYKFRDTSKPFDPSNGNKTELQVQFTSKFSMVSQVVMVCFLIVTVFSAKKIAVHKRIIFAQSVMLVMFLITIAFVVIDTDSWQNQFYGLTLAMGCILNASSAISLLSCFQLCFKFPPCYLAAQMSGQAICGIFASLVQILSLANGQENVKLNAVIYFGTGALCILLTIMLYIYQRKKSEFFISYDSMAVDDNEDERPKPTKQALFDVLKKVKIYIICMIIVLGTTSLIHPGLTALVQSVRHDSTWNKTFFVPTITYFMFNTFDLIGRELATKLKLSFGQYFLLLISILRIVFVPLVMLCNATPRQHLPIVFNSDTAYIIIIIMFALSNGYLFNTSVVAVPTVTTKDEQHYVFILVFAPMLLSMMICSLINSVIIKSI